MFVILPCWLGPILPEIRSTCRDDTGIEPPRLVTSHIHTLERGASRGQANHAIEGAGGGVAPRAEEEPAGRTPVARATHLGGPARGGVGVRSGSWIGAADGRWQGLELPQWLRHRREVQVEFVCQPAEGIALLGSPKKRPEQIFLTDR